jgi:hypothetical protein
LADAIIVFAREYFPPKPVAAKEAATAEPLSITPP